MPVDVTDAELEFRHNAILAEGPVWDEMEERLWWVDILNGQLFICEPADEAPLIYDMGEHLGAAVPREQGGAILALKSGFGLFDFEKKTVTHLANPEAHLPGNRFNDGKCDPSGRFWAGTMSYDLDEGAGSLYCMNTSLAVDVKLHGVTISNGMAWNRERDRMYYIDTVPGEIYMFNYDDTTGEISNRTLIKKVPKTEGYPDGMTIDQEGCLWVALYGGSKVMRIDPDSGETVYQVRLPVPKPTSCTFGGLGLGRLYITTAREHMTKEEIEEYPLSGSVFRANVPFKGVPVDRFAG